MQHRLQEAEAVLNESKQLVSERLNKLQHASSAGVGVGGPESSMMDVDDGTPNPAASPSAIPPLTTSTAPPPDPFQDLQRLILD
jgi:hypothetical protein